jgi:hypothetical protein
MDFIMKTFILRNFLLLFCFGLFLVATAFGQPHSPPTAAVPALASFYTGTDKLEQTYDSTAGSPYFSEGWMKGKANLTLTNTIPKPNEILFFNFDKAKNTLITAEPSGQLTYYTPNLVNSFELYDSLNKVYSFEKVPLISNSFFLSDLVKSNKGFSLYKRYISKQYVADQVGTLNKEGPDIPHTAFSSVLMYYVVYPDKGSFKTFQLNVKAFKKAMKDAPVDMDQLLSKYKDHFTESDLIDVINQMNVKYQ